MIEPRYGSAAAASATIEFAAETHEGNRYPHNEDALGWREERGVWLVADGMGGHARGDIASGVVVQTILNAARDPNRTLPELIGLAHEAVLLEGIDQGLQNMGSTVVVLRVADGDADIAWVGDSRVYLWREGELVRLTRDHSLLEQLIESGLVEPEQAFGHPQAHVLIQALGIDNPRPVAGSVRLSVARGDWLLLCSDGLHDELRDTEIAAVLAGCSRPLEAIETLMARVLAGTARDNVSVICLAPGGPADGAIESPSLLRDRLRRQHYPQTSTAGAPAQEPEPAAPAANAVAPARLTSAFAGWGAWPLIGLAGLAGVVLFWALLSRL